VRLPSGRADDYPAATADVLLLTLGPAPVVGTRHERLRQRPSAQGDGNRPRRGLERRIFVVRHSCAPTSRACQWANTLGGGQPRTICGACRHSPAKCPLAEAA